MFEVILLTIRMGLTLTTEAYNVPSASMWPTIEVRDLIVTSRLARVPDYGDVIVFRFPAGGRTDYVKRVVALPGDHVAFAGSQPIINGWRVPRCSIGKLGYHEVNADDVGHQGEAFVEFLGKYQYLVFEERDMAAERKTNFDVPGGEFFVAGDNRSNSHDSRNFADPPLLPKSASGEAKAKLEACMANKPSITRPPKRK